LLPFQGRWRQAQSDKRNDDKEIDTPQGILLL
jgi:hypothetical protein